MTVFKTVALNHSATLPCKIPLRFSLLAGLLFVSNRFVELNSTSLLPARRSLGAGGDKQVARLSPYLSSVALAEKETTRLPRAH